MTNTFASLDDRLAVEADEHDWHDRDSAWELANDEPEYSQGPQSDLDWSRLDEPPCPLPQSIRYDNFSGGLDYSCLEEESCLDDDIPF